MGHSVNSNSCSLRPPSGIRECLTNILDLNGGIELLNGGIELKHLRFVVPLREQPDHRSDGDPRSFDAGLPTHNGGVHHDAVKLLHRTLTVGVGL